MNGMENRTFRVKFEEDGQTFPVRFREDAEFKVDFGPTVEKEYHEQYEVVPAAEAQTLHTTNRILTEDIIIDPIPSNYGRITWDGSIITVS